MSQGRRVSKRTRNSQFHSMTLLLFVINVTCDEIFLTFRFFQIRSSPAIVHCSFSYCLLLLLSLLYHDYDYIIIIIIIITINYCISYHLCKCKCNLLFPILYVTQIVFTRTILFIAVIHLLSFRTFLFFLPPRARNEILRSCFLFERSIVRVNALMIFYTAHAP
jgi:hypothetical protein